MNMLTLLLAMVGLVSAKHVTMSKSGNSCSYIPVAETFQLVLFRRQTAAPAKPTLLPYLL